MPLLLLPVSFTYVYSVRPSILGSTSQRRATTMQFWYDFSPPIHIAKLRESNGLDPYSENCLQKIPELNVDRFEQDSDDDLTAHGEGYSSHQLLRRRPIGQCGTSLRRSPLGRTHIGTHVPKGQPVGYYDHYAVPILRVCRSDPTNVGGGAELAHRPLIQPTMAR